MPLNKGKKIIKIKGYLIETKNKAQESSSIYNIICITIYVVMMSD